ncbi:hypothetical protein B0H15DRAFT_299819 [Mycena belliarum]|uniref:Uncharacterized protein n=1 Tax=Mycena belliarum TaxID=1033014 RepID=A0AAD6U5J5_9AGAR|nr:hypothetical protein B0H15DRAFT_299819 [Mycena belliae]
MLHPLSAIHPPHRHRAMFVLSYRFHCSSPRPFPVKSFRIWRPRQPNVVRSRMHTYPHISESPRSCIELYAARADSITSRFPPPRSVLLLTSWLSLIANLCMRSTFASLRSSLLFGFTSTLRVYVRPFYAVCSRVYACSCSPTLHTRSTALYPDPSSFPTKIANLRLLPHSHLTIIMIHRANTLHNLSLIHLHQTG